LSYARFLRGVGRLTLSSYPLDDPPDDYAVDSLELVVRANAVDAPVSVWSELRAREKAMGTTWDARQGMRIRYVPPGTEGPAASVASLDAYRDL